MSDDAEQQDPMDGEGAAPVVDPVDGTDWRAWRQLWQVPAIVGGLALIAFAIVVARDRQPAEDWDGALDEVARLIGLEQFDPARDRLVGTLEPNLAEATTRQRARFHALAADWVGRSQERRSATVEANERTIDEQYGRAVSLGLMLDAERLERWGFAQLSLGRIDEARDRVLELETLADSGGGEASRRRNRLLRAIVEQSLRDGDLPLDAMLAALARYVDDERLEDADRAWSLGREVDLLLEGGRFADASRSLMLGMRRLEMAGADLDADTWAGFYVQLAEVADRLGDTAEARHHLARAEERFENATLARGRAEMLRAHLIIEEGAWAEALPHLDAILESFPRTDLELPARLLRAEVLGVVGRHEEALDAFRTVIERLPHHPSDRDMTPRRIADALVDRHDALLAVGDLDGALAYVAVGETLYDPLDVPADVLEAMASTTLNVADALMRSARRAVVADGPDPDADPADVAEAAIPIEVRAAAQARLEQAGGYFLRHASAILAVPGADEAWARSLWLAADAFDRAGLPDEAIDAMESYLEARHLDDPRRPEVLLRLGRTLASIGRHEDAILRFGQVSDEHPRSPFGTEAFAPLAASLLALDREPEAEQVLLAVVEGRQSDAVPLTPGAADYRRALVDLGRLLHRQGRHREAIERLDAALSRDPGANDADELRAWLASSHGGLADTITTRLAAGGAMSPAERADLERRRAAHLERCLDLHDRVVTAWSEIPEDRLDARRRAMLQVGYLGRARAAYDLGRWEQAARLYDGAARRYAGRYVSLQALVQIVNAYERLGDTARADIAHRSALVRLTQLPDAAFDAPEAVLDRSSWEQWLRDRPVGALATADPGAAGGAP